jgi:hypothetical protein
MLIISINDNQIIGLLIEGASGYTNQTVNLGAVRNKGIELALGFVPIRTKNFQWDLNVNYTKIENNVERLGLTDNTEILLNRSYNVELKAVVGKPLGAIYAPKPLTNDKGQIVVNPATGLPLTSPDKEYRGSINPDYSIGFGTSVKYKNFTLGGNGDFRKGGVFYSYTARLNYFVGNAYETQYNDREPWVIPNSVVANTDGSYSENTNPISRSNVFTYYGATNSWESKHVLDRTFLKLRNVFLNYELPAGKLGKISKATVGVFGRNLFMWTPSENHFVDPEANTFGTNLSSLYGEFASGPSTSTYGIQLNLTF